MCGICGIISSDRQPVEPAVRRMMQAMVHRGPDDEGYEELPLGESEAGPIAGFGFRRLSILDLSPAGHQPMFNSRTGDCLIFNGEIYNFRALRSELQMQGIVFRGTSDSEVLLHALSTWGEAALERLQGMYAFAFYEATSRRILLARDPLGIKPLYVSLFRDRVVFASESRAVLASGLVPADLDIGGVAGMLAYGAVQSPLTIHQHIRQFPAGTSQWIDAGVTAGRPPAPPRRHWSFPQRPNLEIDRATAVATVRQLLRDAVLRHVVADVPVGVFLSAGIDSTVIASFARDYTPRVTAFTVGFGSLDIDDEAGPAARTAAALGIRHVAVPIDATELPSKWREWIAAMDSPSIDGFNTFLVSRRLAREGVVVGLSGLGADELFGGYPSFSRAPRLSRLLGVLRVVPPGSRAAAVRALGAVDGRVGAFEKAADMVAGDSSVAGVARALRRTLSNRHLALMGITPQRAHVRGDYLAADASEPSLDDDGFNTVSRLEMTNYMGDTLLRDTDANSMSQSLEVRVPFLDLPLVDYVSGLPGRLKRGGGQGSKALLREAGRGVLPAEIATRPKTGFTLPIGFWMTNQMRDDCEAAISRLEGVPFLEAAEIRHTWNAFLNDRRAMHWSRPLALVALGSRIG